MYFALANGGPAAWFFSYIIVSFGALCQTASFAEMASIQPIAGAQYYWTYVSGLMILRVPLFGLSMVGIGIDSCDSTLLRHH